MKGGYSKDWRGSDGRRASRPRIKVDVSVVDTYDPTPLAFAIGTHLLRPMTGEELDEAILETAESSDDLYAHLLIRGGFIGQICGICVHPCLNPEHADEWADGKVLLDSSSLLLLYVRLNRGPSGKDPISPEAEAALHKIASGMYQTDMRVNLMVRIFENRPEGPPTREELVRRWKESTNGYPRKA